MEALGNMLADGWPLALAGFVIGALVGGLAQRGDRAGEAPVKDGAAPDGDTLKVLAEELKKAHDLLGAEEAEAAETAESLKNLDEAIKRANGRLKLMAKAVRKGK